MIEEFQISPRETITFYVSEDAEWLTDNVLRANGLGNRYRAGKLESFGSCSPTAEFAVQSVFVCTGAPEWSRGEAFQQMVLGHEYFHALSSDLAGDTLAKEACCYDPKRIGPLGPEWLKEGGAQYAAMVPAAALGYFDLEAELRNWAKGIRGIDLDLKRRNTRDGYVTLDRSLSEVVGVLASHALVQQAGATALPNYYRYLGYGVGHDAAFKWAFGRSLEDFQPIFEVFVQQYL